MDQLIQRRISPVVRQRSTETPVLLLEGPRSVGKSVLLRQFAADLDQPVFDLDQMAQRQLAQDNPSAVAGDMMPVMIDEYQRAPALLDAIKVRLNQGTAPGMFVFCGFS